MTEAPKTRLAAVMPAIIVGRNFVIGWAPPKRRCYKSQVRLYPRPFSGNFAVSGGLTKPNAHNYTHIQDKFRSLVSQGRNEPRAMLGRHCQDYPMYTIVAASQKGGSGKTTLSGHLAVEATRAGAGEIALIDTDPQGSLAAWWNARTAPTPRFVEARLPDLEEALPPLNRAA